MFRGFIAIIPVFLCVIALKILYVLIDKKVIAFISRFVEVRHIPGLGIVLLLVVLYFIGLIASNILGRQFFLLIERVTERIPFIKAIYGVGKQFSQSLAITSSDGNKAFQRAVLVDIDNNNLWVSGFITSTLTDQKTKGKLFLVYVPATHPYMGYLFAVSPSQVKDPGWTAEESLKMIVSLGIVTPK